MTRIAQWTLAACLVGMLPGCGRSGDEARATGGQLVTPAPARPASSEPDKPVFAQQPANDLVTVDNLVVQYESNGADINWEDAEAYCSTLALGGFRDWRLPAREELEKLFRSGKFPKDGYVYWSSSRSGGDRAWFVGFGSGAANEFGMKYKSDSRVRCVREGN